MYGAALHVALQCSYEEILEELWFWAREVHLNISDHLLLARDNNEQTASYINIEVEDELEEFFLRKYIVLYKDTTKCER